MSEKQYMCGGCGHVISDSKTLTAINPFCARQEVHGCPDCFCVNDLTLVCDEPKCYELATGGYPTDGGYRRTCGAHMKIGGTREQG